MDISEAIKLTEGVFNRHELQKVNQKLYRKLLRAGLLDVVFGEGYKKPVKWTDEELREVASKYSKKIDFKRGSYNQYWAALRRGLLGEICSHMVSGHGNSDSDTVYFLKSDQKFEGLPVYKFGVTSFRLGDVRRKHLEGRSGFVLETLFFEKRLNAVELEQRLLQLGVCPYNERFEGYTEYRALSDLEVNMAMNMLGEVN